MRVRSIQARGARLDVVVRVAAVALVIAGASACSKGSKVDTSSIKPNLPSSSASPSPSQSGSSPASATTAYQVPSYDASSAMAVKLQQTGCKAALSPLFSSVVNGIYPRDRVIAATPAAARAAMTMSLDTYAQILSQDPHAANDGQAGKAAKPLDDFCYTPAGAPLVGTTPVDALKPVKAPKPSPTHR